MKYLARYWPYILIILVTLIYFIYLVNDSRFFFYDDFTGFTFAVPRTYWQIIIDSLASRDIDRHKILGYLLMKALYHLFGLKVNVYFFVLFLFHTFNSFLVYKLLFRITNRKSVSALLSVVFAYRFYLWWLSNIENYLAGFFYFLSLHWWISFNSTQNKKYLFLLWLALPLMVYSYGSGIFLYLSLIPFTLYLYGWNDLWKRIKHLLPFLAVFTVYLIFYLSVPDSLYRFAASDTPYYRPLSLSTLIFTQSIYVNLLSNWLSQSVPITIALWTAAILIGRKAGWLLLAFLLAILPNSFFPNHTMFYYLYFPIIFVLLFFAHFISRPRPILAVLLFWLIFNPALDLSKVAFRLRHPALNFEEIAMTKIAKLTDESLKTNERQLKLSNWEVTPNLHHAITYGALPYWLTYPQKNEFNYGYNRDSEMLLITPK